jgi:hypothetical protein
MRFTKYLKVVREMQFSKELLDKVSDGDQHTKLIAVEYSTSLREVVTLGYMLEYPRD